MLAYVRAAASVTVCPEFQWHHFDVEQGASACDSRRASWMLAVASAKALSGDMGTTVEGWSLNTRGMCACSLIFYASTLVALCL